MNEPIPDGEVPCKICGFSHPPQMVKFQDRDEKIEVFWCADVNTWLSREELGG